MTLNFVWSSVCIHPTNLRPLLRKIAGSSGAKSCIVITSLSFAIWCLASSVQWFIDAFYRNIPENTSNEASETEQNSEVVGHKNKTLNLSPNTLYSWAGTEQHLSPHTKLFDQYLT